MPAPKARPFVAPTNVVSLMDALRQSIAAEAKAGVAPKNVAAAGTTTAITKPKMGKQRIAGQGELLLPIAGRKAQPKEDTKPATQPEGIKPAPQPAGRRKAGSRKSQGGNTLFESAAYPESMSQPH
jgi:hypothetical protein